MIENLTPDESALVRDVQAGAWARFGTRSRDDVVIRAEVVRDLVRGDALPSGVKIDGVTIRGVIDLSDARGGHAGGCNGLDLKGCLLVGGDPDHAALDASNSVLAMLTITDCEARAVDLTNIVVHGDLRVSGLSSPDGIDGTCWLRARGARVDGAVRIADTRLRLPAWPSPAWPPADDPAWAEITSPFALDLRDARIAGTFACWSGVVARGGVDLSYAKVGGDLWALGTSVAAAGVGRDPTAAFRAQGIVVGGSVSLVEYNGVRFDVTGSVSFHLARIGGGMWVEGATCHVQPAIEDADGVEVKEAVALGLRSASILGDLSITDFVATDPVVLTNASVGGMATIEHGRVTAFDAAFGNSLWVQNGGELTVIGSSVARDAEFSGKNAPIEHLWARGLKVGGDLTITGTLSGLADLQGCEVARDLILGPDLIIDGTRGPWAGINLRGSTIRLALRIAGLGVRGARIANPLSLRIANARPRRLASIGLDVFPGWRLGEATFDGEHHGESVVLAFAFRPDDPTSATVLDGNSGAVFGLADVPRLGTADDVAAYVRFFCAYVWGDEGAFEILSPSIAIPPHPDHAPDIPAPSAPVKDADGNWTMVATVRYGKGVFRARFKVIPSGEIEMVDDWPLAELDVSPWGRPEQPFRVIGPANAQARRAPMGDPPDAPLSRRTRWPTFSARSAATALDHIQRQVRDIESSKPRVDLRGVTSGELHDQDGRGWSLHDESRQDLPQARLFLDGFDYARLNVATYEERRVTDAQELEVREADKGDRKNVASGNFRAAGSTTSDSLTTIGSDVMLERRLRVIRQGQYGTGMPRPEDYRPQPFEHLATLWRAEGRSDGATEVTFQKLALERLVFDKRVVTGWVRRSFWAMLLLFSAALLLIVSGTLPGDLLGSVVLVGLLAFGLLLLPTRILRLWVFQRAFGYGLKLDRALWTFVGLWVLGGALVTFWTSDLSGNVIKVDAAAVGTIAVGPDDPSPAVPVVDGLGAKAEIPCRNLIDPMLYALDVMVPLLDLRQEQRCTISAEGAAWPWRFLKVMYAVAGWIVVSGLVLTASGFIRRHVER